MGLGYLTMHLTFVSLYVSLRRLGSNFWLATSVLFSSAFGCLFGVLVTMRLGVPINAVLLSEGLPFLVVLIGFEKPIVLTKAVLSASLAMKKPSARANSVSSSSGSSRQQPNAPPTIQTAIQVAVKDVGYEIIWDYAVEELFLVLGAASGVQGGLCQFCFLAAWILFFDCILLFTFYTAILTIKLEINRIKRHVALRRALEEDGVSRKVAEEVAANDEWPKLEFMSGDSAKRPYEGLLFGGRVRDSHIAKFKALMVTIFLVINIINFASIPFRSGARSTGSALSSVVTQPPMDPFKVAGTGLDNLLSTARRSGLTTRVTVLPPIKYEMEYPSVYYALPEASTGSIFDMDFTDHLLERVGGRVVESILKSLEDPLLSKWVIIALGLSLLLNGYLFNAARWSIKDPSQLGVDAVTRLRSMSQGDNAIKASAGVTAATNGTAVQQGVPSEHKVHIQETLQPDGVSRSTIECEALVKEGKAALLEDEELIQLTVRGKIPGYALEKTLGNKTRAVKIRRGLVSRTPATTEITALLEKSLLPYEGYNYDVVFGACCENVIGYLPLPLGVAGPIVVDGRSYYLPMATTEGVLVASTSRGAKAINAGGGVVTVLTGDGMTRGPCVGFSTLARAGEAKLWIDSDEGQKIMKAAFNSTSRFARLQSCKTALAGTYLYIRFRTTTGDAMGMNMISKGVEHALSIMANEAGFDDMQIISVSGNYCIDKKAAAINWIEGRGKSVVAEAIIPAEVVRNVLKSSVEALIELNISKNLIGSAMAGTIGGNNAHAANIVAAIFLATGQDPAQVVESSMCITTMRK
jgi:hydroxymethylglutaryl-CoA reductase (NADPH)